MPKTTTEAKVGLRITIPGTPRGKGRPRFNRETGRAYTDDKTALYENWVAICARQAAAGMERLEGPLTVSIVAVFPRPKKPKYSYPPKTDLDNVVKAILDGIQQAGVWRDDSQVCKITAEKIYSQPEGEPGVDVIVVEQG